ncbi:MAG: MarR family EPS-associated transcriptional regulator [Candidatus Omnitrophica bacterium]|nr:MarR family EPS-associated transcriptional regulator [Candidatus Omnitrophota bacterium]
MIEQDTKEEILSIIRHIESDPAITQRDLSLKLGVSLGKTNYLLKALVKKGLIKAGSFSRNPGKMKKIHYVLTQRGFEERIQLMRHFLLRKEQEYYRLKREWESLKNFKDL